MKIVSECASLIVSDAIGLMQHAAIIIAVPWKFWLLALDYRSSQFLVWTVESTGLAQSLMM